MQLQLRLYLACNPHVFTLRRSAKPLTMGCENEGGESLVRNKGKLPMNVMICQFWSGVKVHKNNAGIELYPNRDGKLSPIESHPYWRLSWPSVFSFCFFWCPHQVILCMGPLYWLLAFLYWVFECRISGRNISVQSELNLGRIMESAGSSAVCVCAFKYIGYINADRHR